MEIAKFLTYVEKRGRKPTRIAIRSFEKQLGATLPDEYVSFLERCNGGYVGGELWFTSPSKKGVGAGVDHIGGLRREDRFSLRARRNVYQVEHRWIPDDLLWIIGDPFGNATCIGIRGKHRGKVYFWDHENVPEESHWDGRVETAGNIKLLAPSMSAFIDGCAED